MHSTIDDEPSPQSDEALAKHALNAAHEGLRAVGIAYLGVAVVFVSGVLVVDARWAEYASLAVAVLFALAAVSYWMLRPSHLSAAKRQEALHDLIADTTMLVAASSIMAVWGIATALLLAVVDAAAEEGRLRIPAAGVAAMALGAIALLFTRFQIRAQRASGFTRFPFASIGPLFPFGPLPDASLTPVELIETLRLLRERVPQIDAVLDKLLATALGQSGEELEGTLREVACLHAEKVGLVYFGQDFIIGPSPSDVAQSVSLKVPLLLVPLAAAAHAPLSPFFLLSSEVRARHRRHTAQRFHRFRADPFEQPWLEEFPLDDMRMEVERLRSEPGDQAKARLEQRLLEWAPGPTLDLEPPSVLIDRITSWLRLTDQPRESSAPSPR